jgi:hypothetical protein
MARRVFTLFLLLGSSSGCVPKAPVAGDEPLPPFSLVDVNPHSTTFGMRVGPENYRGRVTGWYFTHST